MSQPLPELQIDRLSITERLELIAQLWDSLPESLENVPVPEWHQQEIARRLQAADAEPGSRIPWEQARERLRNRS